MADSLGRSSSKVSTQGLRRLASAYDVSTPTLDAIADAIIARTILTDGEYQRGVVMDLVAFILQDQATLAVLEKGTRVREDVLKQMAELIASDPPATVPEWDLVQIVIEDVQSILSRLEPRGTRE